MYLKLVDKMGHENIMFVIKLNTIEDQLSLSP